MSHHKIGLLCVLASSTHVQLVPGNIPFSTFIASAAHDFCGLILCLLVSLSIIMDWSHYTSNMKMVTSTASIVSSDLFCSWCFIVLTRSLHTLVNIKIIIKTCYTSSDLFLILVTALFPVQTLTCTISLNT